MGGAAAVLHGAPLTTFDLDIVPRRTPENAARLLSTLESLDAVFRDPSGREIRPTLADLSGSGQPNLMTRLGPLDVLCVLSDGRGYEELFARSERREDGTLSVLVLDLETLIQVKAALGRPKDRLAVPVLLALLAQRRDEGGG